MIYTSLVSFALGIIFEEIFSFGWSLGLFILIISSLISLVIWRENFQIGRWVFIVGLAFSLGVLRINVLTTPLDPNLLESLGSEVSFEAVVDSEPDERDTTVRYIVKPDSSKSLILLVADRFPLFLYGDQIKVSGKLDLPKNFTSDNGVDFDYVSYLSKDKIHFIIYRPKIEKVASTKGLVFYLYSFKNIFIKNISEVVPEPNAALLSGMIFGAKQSLGAELLDQFKKVGLIHIVVLSGQNITIIAAGIFLLTSYFLKRNVGFVISAVAIILFSLMVGPTATVVRASIMAMIAILARFLGRPTDALRWLFIAGFLMLLYNPLTLIYDPSFQLSFMATLGLIIFSPFVYLFISQKLPFVTNRFALREIISSTIAVQIFILPLLVRMSGVVSLISFVINPLILPFTPLLMTLGGLTGGFGLISNIFSWPFGMLSYLLTEFVIKTVELFSSLPFATLPIGHLSLWMIMVWYGFYGLIYYKLKNKVVS